jgi:hypothetical protein
MHVGQNCSWQMRSSSAWPVTFWIVGQKSQSSSLKQVVLVDEDVSEVVTELHCGCGSGRW